MPKIDNHPSLALYMPRWNVMADTFEGEDVVKGRGTMYLPMTQRMKDDGGLSGNTASDGWQAYLAYKQRARFPEFVADAIETLLGVMHGKPATIELPPEMEYLRTDASRRNESLELLLQRISLHQLRYGRLGLLGDVIDRGPGEGNLYIALYEARSVLDWDVARGEDETEYLRMVLLDESGWERDSDTRAWVDVDRYKVLTISDLFPGGPEYRVAELVDDDADLRGLTAGDFTPVSARGRTPAEIPFQFVNAVDLSPEPSRPPLLGLAMLALAAYRGEADYRQALFLQGQDTLVVTGVGDDDEDWKVGAGAALNLPAGATAEYVGVTSNGLPEMRMAQDALSSEGKLYASKLTDSATRERESGEALRIRVATRTASLNRIVVAGAAGLERLLKQMASWIGADPDQVSVQPNTDFTDVSMSGQDMKDIMEARKGGFPLSFPSIHKMARDRNLTELSFEQEIAAMEQDRDYLERVRIETTTEGRPAGQGNGAPAPDDPDTA